jgi:predicted double-glycine peptidase
MQAVLLALALAAPVPLKQLHGVPDVIQANNYSCGAGVVQAVMQYYGHWGYQDGYARELGTSPDQGTHPARMTEFFKKRGLDAELREGMTAADLRRHVDRGIPVIVDFQAWGKPGLDYAHAWEDGHYCVVVGYDRKGFFLEDPSLLGTVGYLRTADFERRWRDYEIEGGKRRPYVRAGIVIKGKPKPPPRVSPIE